MTIEQEVLMLLDEVLGLNGRTAGFTAETALLGVLPELDSMAVIGVLNALEERYGLMLDDDEIDGSLFATVGSLTHFVQAKLGA